MRRKGLYDIKTYGSLVRKGGSISVARNLHRLGSRGSEGGIISDDWRIGRHIYPKKKPTRSRPASGASLHRELFLGNRARLYQLGVVQDFLQEMRQAIAEGIPVAMEEFERLMRRLAELKTG